MKNEKGGIKGKRRRYADKNKQKSHGGKPYAKPNNRNRQNPNSAALRAEKTAQKKAKKTRAPSANTNLSQNSQYIQWFPGHMAKTRRLIAECLSDVDIVLELLDARIPRSSKNPEILKLTAGKPKLTLLNKSSLSDPAENDAWLSHYEKTENQALLIDCVTGEGIAKIGDAVRRILSDKIAKNEARVSLNSYRRSALGNTV